jgi:hypothetical protein
MSKAEMVPPVSLVIPKRIDRGLEKPPLVRKPMALSAPLAAVPLTNR